jgi:ubiquinone/menaquinone biosynthesis C-methylase UbiE
VDQLLETTYRAEERHFWFRGFRRFVAPLIAEAVAGVSDPRILDAGCGTGRNLLMLDAFGSPCGIDLNALGLSFAARKGRRTVARATVTDLPFPDRTFDLVTSFDVLYALDDAQEPRAFAEMARVLKPTGGVVINVAAMDVVRGGHSAVLGAERRRYTLESMRRSLVGCGLRPVRLTYTNASLFPMLAAVRTMQRLTGWPVPGIELEVPLAPINGLLAGVLALEAAVVRRLDMPFGSSVLCLARKS